mgnify:CR=1 FL=1
MSIYRRLYEHIHGSIPSGYHIHHKDGNHSNNDLSNLVAVTAKEHYDIHYSQGDYGACWAMYRTGHLTLTPEERSLLVSKQQQELMKKNKHPFQKSETKDKLKSVIQKQIDDGTHHFLSGDIQREENRKRVEQGTHNLLGNNNPIHKRVANGLHQDMIRKENENRLTEGTHNFKLEWTCEKCGKTGTNQTNYIRWHGSNCKMNKE